MVVAGITVFHRDRDREVKCRQSAVQKCADLRQVLGAGAG